MEILLKIFAVVGLGFFFGASLIARAENPQPIPTVTVTVTPAPAPVAEPSPTPTAPPLSAVEGQQLLKNFDRAQSTLLNALKHRQRVEINELVANQKHRTKEWETSERQKRREFFEKNPAGKDRRPYVKDFLERRKVFRKLLKDELDARKRENEVRRKALVAEMSEKRKLFRDALKKKSRPDPSLWPQANQ
jgi:hypothetical protein